MRKQNALESVDNALRLLLLLADRDQVRVSDAATELDIALSTAHRLMSTLRERGFVEQLPNRSYVKGAAFALLGGSAPEGLRGDRILEIVEPLLARLRDQVDESAHFSVLDGTDMRFELSCESTQPLRIGSRVGVRQPAYLTSGGKAVLAALPVDELARHLPPKVADAPADAPVAQRVRRELAAVRRQGYGVNRSESERGVGAVGVALFGPARQPVGALSISVPTVRLNAARMWDMVAALRAAAPAVEAALGGGATRSA